jgi:hypothetical protein
VKVLLHTVLILALDGSEFVRGMARKTRTEKQKCSDTSRVKKHKTKSREAD